MKKLIRLSFICAVLFACIEAQAQVIESVSFTPAKTGVYGTIATKSVTSFAGNLTTQNATGLGHKLTLDTKANSPFSTNTSLGAFRDVYMPAYQPSISSNTKIGLEGKLLNTGNATITNSKVNLIYGGNVDFNKISSLLAVNGALNIHNVKMSDPKCNIKWILLPAYKQSTDYSETNNTATSSNYWFAYCDADSTGDDTTTQDTWVGTTSSFSGLAVCSAGLSEYNDCTRTYNSNGEIATSSFTCTDITTYKCNSSIRGVDIINSQGYNQCKPTSQIAVLDQEAYDFCNGCYATCAGLIRRYPAKFEYYGGYGDKVAGYPIASVDCRLSNCNSSEVVSAKKNLFNRDNATLCGFSETGVGGNFQSHGAKALAAVKNYPTCLNKTELKSCWAKAGVAYSTYASWLDYSDSQLCQAIATANTSVGSSFSCVKNTPGPTTYKAFRVAPCVTGTKTFKKCYDGYCVPNNSSDMWCKGNSQHPKGIQDTPVTVGYVKTPDGWASATNPNDGRLYLSNELIASGNASGRGDDYQFNFTNETKYIPQVFNGIILNCETD